MVNYQNGKIYAIKSNSGGKIYVGSTTKDYLSKRMSHHRTAFKAWEDGNGFCCSSRELFIEYGVENCYIELIELFPCETKDELKTRENHYIRSLVCVNKHLAVNTKSKKENDLEYYQKNKEDKRRKVMEYREKNMEKCKSRVRIYAAKRRAWNKISREFMAILQED